MLRHVFMAGIGNSEPEHWQSLWARSIPDSVWVDAPGWDQPVRDQWVAALLRDAQRAGRPSIVVAHSLGCLAVADASAELAARGVVGAFLVAVPDTQGPKFPSAARGFKHALACELRLPSVVVASTDDPYSSFEHADQAAKHWNSRFVCVGEKGHINLASNLGDWEEGRRLLSDFSTTLTS